MPNFAPDSALLASTIEVLLLLSPLLLPLLLVVVVIANILYSFSTTSSSGIEWDAILSISQTATASSLSSSSLISSRGIIASPELYPLILYALPLLLGTIGVLVVLLSLSSAIGVLLLLSPLLLPAIGVVYSSSIIPIAL